MDIQIALPLKIQSTSYHGGQTLASLGLVSIEQRLILSAFDAEHSKRINSNTISAISCLLLHVCQCLQVQKWLAC